VILHQSAAVPAAAAHEAGLSAFKQTPKQLVRLVVEQGGVIVATYESLRTHKDTILPVRWDYAVLDEGHRIRNPDAEITLYIKQLQTVHRLLLSGAPIQNNLKELWSLFDFVFPGRLGTLPAFINEFVLPIRLGGYACASQMQVQMAYRCALVLRQLISPYLLRRLKKDVVEMARLPKKTEQVLFCRLTPWQKQVYEAYIAGDEVRSVVAGRMQAFRAIGVLRKICNHPDILKLELGQTKIRGGPEAGGKKRGNGIRQGNIQTGGQGGGQGGGQAGGQGARVKSEFVGDPFAQMGEADEEADEGAEDGAEDGSIIGREGEGELEGGGTETYGHFERSAKLQVLNAVLPEWEHQGHRVLLFCQTVQMLNVVEGFVRRHPKRWRYLRMDGQSSIGSRQELVDTFNEDDSVFLFLLTTRVGGLGVNLTGANRVVLIDPDWNPSTDIQARERAWRLGQTRAVTVYRLITRGTIEEKIYHRQIFKQYLTNKVTNHPSAFSSSLSPPLLSLLLSLLLSHLLFSHEQGAQGSEAEKVLQLRSAARSVQPRP
jgi:DNA excision repair protein ERCC-6